MPLKYSKIPDIARKAGVHTDTIYKAARLRRASRSLAAKLEKVTGINHLQFEYPDKFGDGWNVIMTPNLLDIN